MDVEPSQPNTLELAADLTIAWLSNPNTTATADDVPAFLQKMHSAIVGIGLSDGAQEEPVAGEFVPAVSVRKSLASKDHIVSMIDGKKYKTLRRHLSTHGLTPEQYRERYNLKPDYPMVSESYSQVRRDMAKKIGLGRKPGEKPGQRKKTAGTSSRGGRKPKAG